MKTQKKKKHPQRNIDIGYYTVAFLDVLGQQEKLRSLRSLPDKSNEEQMDTFIKDLKGTYGVVTSMRKMFKDFFRSFSKRDTDVSILTADQRKIYKQLTSNPIQIKSFSDAIIVFVSLRTDKVKLPTRGIWGIMAAAASTALLSLAAGHPIRGGIDIGLGMEIEEGEIYGPSLARAYSLESKIAQYPRIVVGKECIDYLQMTARLKPNDIYSEVGSISAKQCLKLLTIDDDGCPIIDFLGDHFWQSTGNIIEKEIIDKAYQNIIKFSQKFKNENDTKKAFRYTLLRGYFEHRLANWKNNK
ncbi:MAG: hypothetical protein AB1427_21125 [Thermodesulfobacteriota bacterium]